MNCESCNTPLVGRYCHACGERVIDTDELRVPVFIGKMASGAFDLDSRLWRTVRELFARPGRLTADYMRGRRRPYLSPIQSFLIANVLFFAVLGSIGGANVFTIQLRYHVNQPFYGAAAARAVAERVAPGTAEAEVFAQRFDEASPRYANSLVILLVPLFAAGLALQFIGTRRLFVQHLVFALHFMTALLLVVTVVPLLIAGLLLIRPGMSEFWRGSEGPITLVFVAIFWTYLAIGIRRAYGTGTVSSIVRGLVGVLSLMPVVIVYRAILFFTVFYAVG